MSIFTRLFEKRRILPDQNGSSETVFVTGTSSLEANPTVQACISKIANTISELPLTLYVRRKGGGRSPAYFHPLYDVVKNPSIEETPTLFYSTLIRQLLTNGNAYLYINRSGQDIVGFTIIDAKKVKVNRDARFRKYYKINETEYSEKEILHIPYPLGYDGTTGRSPIKVYSELIQLDNELLQYISTFFRNSVGTRMTLKMIGKYDSMEPDKAYAALVPLINKFVTGAQNAGKTMILPPNTEAGKIELPSNSEAELRTLLDKVERLIALGFNVPWSLISEENKYNSREQQQLNFMQETIQPLGNHISESIAKLLSASDKPTMYFAYNYKVLLETDIKTTVEFLSKEIFSGLITVNEARDKMDLDSIGEEGDVHWLPSSYFPVTKENIDAFFSKAKTYVEEPKAASEQSSTTE